MRCERCWFSYNFLSIYPRYIRGVASHRVWQTLPRHLRRRAASHNVRRVPVRLREKAKLEVCIRLSVLCFVERLYTKLTSECKIDPVKRGKFIKLLKRKRRQEHVSGRTQKFLKRQGISFRCICMCLYSLAIYLGYRE